MVNFSSVMAAIVKRYGGHVHIDPINQNNDVFLCPRCNDHVVYGNWNGEIEEIKEGENIKYICPICKKSF